MTAASTSAELAEAALETLVALRKHTLNCKQCQFDTSFCTTYAHYANNFESEFKRWRESR